MIAIASHPAVAEPRRILVVDDEILTRLDIAEQLREAGYAVVEAGDSNEAMKVLASPIHVDLVVTDVNMPGPVDGLGLARWLRSTAPETRIVVMSGQRVAADRALMDAFFAKPVLGSDLVEQVRSLLVERT